MTQIERHTDREVQAENEWDIYFFLSKEKMEVGLYIKIAICCSILLSILFYIAKNSTKSIYNEREK